MSITQNARKTVDASQGFVFLKNVASIWIASPEEYTLRFVFKQLNDFFLTKLYAFSVPTADAFQTNTNCAEPMTTARRMFETRNAPRTSAHERTSLHNMYTCYILKAQFCHSNQCSTLIFNCHEIIMVYKHSHCVTMFICFNSVTGLNCVTLISVSIFILLICCFYNLG